jgi:hypothetical protein
VALSLHAAMRHDLGTLYKSVGITNGLFLTPFLCIEELHPQCPHHFVRQVSVRVLQHDGPPTKAT